MSCPGEDGGVPELDLVSGGKTLGTIDVVVNNAGYGVLASVEEASDEQIRRVIDTNLLGSIQVIRAALPHLRTWGRGRILQVSTAFSLLPAGIGPELADALLPSGWELAKRLNARSLLEGGERLTMLESVRLFAFDALLQHDSIAVRDRLLDVLATMPEESENIRYAAKLVPDDARLVTGDDEGDETDEVPLWPLSWREERLLRVAAMVGEGLTNKQIADGLHVSLRTVEADVRDLKTVLGVRSRAQIAAWTTQAP